MSRIYIGARRDVTLVLQTAFLRPRVRARARIGVRVAYLTTRALVRKPATDDGSICDRVSRVCVNAHNADRTSCTYERNDRSSYITHNSPLPGTYLPNSSPPNRNRKDLIPCKTRLKFAHLRLVRYVYLAASKEVLDTRKYYSVIFAQ